jgi:ectoine hydroxylase-related dioxygenase (phytanoyl-CoA dioxygenase family)
MAEPALSHAPFDDLQATFRRDGYVVIPGLYSPRWRERVLGDIVLTFRLRAQALGLDLPEVTDQAAFSDLLAGLFRRDIPSYMAAAKLTQHLVSVHQMGTAPELMDAVAALGLQLPAISTRPVIHYMADRLKIPGGYHKTPPHQDWRSVQGSLDGITVWAPLFDVGLGDYPLEVVPRSHLSGLMDSTLELSNFKVLAGQFGEGDFRPLEMKAGDAVLFSGFLLHRTGERGGEDVRVALSFRFNNAAEPTFVERNYPNPYLYRPDPAIVTPGFPSREELQTLFAGACLRPRTVQGA